MNAHGCFLSPAVDSITDVYTVSQLKQRAKEHPEAFFGITYSFISKLDLDSSVSKVIKTQWCEEILNCYFTRCAFQSLLTPVSFFFFSLSLSLLSSISAQDVNSRWVRTCRAVAASCVQGGIRPFQPPEALTYWWISQTTPAPCRPATSEVLWQSRHLAAQSVLPQRTIITLNVK